MEAPTIVRKTKDYILVKIPLSQGGTSTSTKKVLRGDKMTVSEKRSWKRMQEAKEDIRQGRTITAPSLEAALKRYAKQQWD